MIRKVYEVDTMVCPKCERTMEDLFRANFLVLDIDSELIERQSSATHKNNFLSATSFLTACRAGIYRSCQPQKTMLFRMLFHYFEHFVAEYKR